MKRMGMLIFPKCLTLFILTWICHHCNDSYLNNNKFNETNKTYGILGRTNDRLLAKHELANKNLHANLLDKASNYRDNRRIKDGAENITIYKQLGKNNLNKLELYRKDYKKRYNKKNGIAKLECYCENKIFDKFDYISNLQEKMKNDKKLLKKTIYRKYGLPILLVSLFLLIGLIIPILDYNELIHNKFLCDGTGTESSHHESCKTTGKVICYLNEAFSYSLVIIILSASFYVFFKTLKYDRLRKGKLNKLK